MTSELESILGPRPGAEIETTVDFLDEALLRLLDLAEVDEPWEGDPYDLAIDTLTDRERLRVIRQLVQHMIKYWGLPPNACIPGDASFPLRLLREAEGIDQPCFTELAFRARVIDSASLEARQDAEQTWDAALDGKERALGELENNARLRRVEHRR